MSQIFFRKLEAIFTSNISLGAHTDSYRLFYDAMKPSVKIHYGPKLCTGYAHNFVSVCSWRQDFKHAKSSSERSK